MSRASTHVKKGDTVQVISGEFKNASGKVLQVLKKKNQVLIEGVRLIKKAVRKSQDRPEGGIIEREGPLHISNVKLVEAAAAAEDKKAKKPAAKKSRKKGE
jgi:large subunit ribosomal protein L24